MNYTKLALKLEKYIGEPTCKIDLYVDEDEILDKKVQEYFVSEGVVLTNEQVKELMDRACQIGVI